MEPGKCTCSRLATVWLVGGRNGDPFADVYAKKEHAIGAVMGYIFDPHWFNKLPETKRKILEAVKATPDLAIEYYNSVADAEDQWTVVESDVHYELQKALEYEDTEAD